VPGTKKSVTVSLCLTFVTISGAFERCGRTKSSTNRDRRGARKALLPPKATFHLLIVIDPSVVARAMNTHLGQRSTSTRIVDDIRHHTLHIAVTFGKVLRR